MDLWVDKMCDGVLTENDGFDSDDASYSLTRRSRDQQPKHVLTRSKLIPVGGGSPSTAKGDSGIGAATEVGQGDAKREG